MARGNDAKAAAAEFRGQYGVMGNAEDLIQANRAAYPAELRSAQLAAPDEEASKDLDKDKVAKALGIEDGKVLDARIRGDKLVAVVETESGHTYKAVTDADSALKGRPRSDDDQSPDEDAAQRVSEAQAEANRIIAEARAEAERTIQEAREQAVAEASEKAAEAAEAARQEAADAAADAEKANADKAKATPRGKQPPQS